MCVAGTRWVGSEILQKHPGTNVKVYAVWFNMVSTDSRSKWPENFFDNPRVVHFWDEQRVVGHWYEQHVTKRGAGAEWDAYFLYGPQATWRDDPPRLVSWGRTIVGSRDRLQRDFLDLQRARTGQPEGK